MSDLEKINLHFKKKIGTTASKEDLQNLKTEFFGKNGQITNQFKNLGALPANEKKEFAFNLNKLKVSLTEQIEAKNQQIEINDAS